MKMQTRGGGRWNTSQGRRGRKCRRHWGGRVNVRFSGMGGLGAVADENVRTFNWIISTFSVK